MPSHFEVNVTLSDAVWNNFLNNFNIFLNFKHFWKLKKNSDWLSEEVKKQANEAAILQVENKLASYSSDINQVPNRVYECAHLKHKWNRQKIIKT